LPLKPIDPANRSDIFEMGVADSLIQRLSSMKGFIVRPLSATRQYSDIAQDPLAAGREQKVDYVLASNYQIADGKIRITAQLVNVATGQIEETYKTEKDAANLFAMQDAIAADFGNRLMVRFNTKPSGSPAKRGTDNEEAYRNYQHAMTLLDQQRPGSMQKANEYLDRAVELDPNYAQAWAGKANANSVGWNSNRSSNNEKLYQTSMEAAKRAISIDPNLSEAYTSLCDSRFFYELDFDGAETACKRAVELDPNSSLAHMTYTMLLNSRGRFDEAFAEIRTAMDLDPVSLRNQRIFANLLYIARRYDEAIDVYRRLVDLNPDVRMTYLWFIRALDRSGRESEAFEYLIRLLMLERKNNETIERFRAAYASSGWKGAVTERINTELQEENPNYGHLAEYYARVGDKDKAFEYLEKNLQRRAWLMMYVGVDPRFDSLRDDPRFADLIRQVEGK
jgi:adenylate cyclase